MTTKIKTNDDDFRVVYNLNDKARGDFVKVPKKLLSRLLDDHTTMHSALLKRREVQDRDDDISSLA